MLDISFGVAFVAGIISFFAPCVIPLLPAYMGYITGVSLQELQTYGIAGYRLKLFISSIFYILGFSTVFVFLGATAAGIGQILRHYADVIRIIGGVLILIFGANVAGYLSIYPFFRAFNIRLPSWIDHLGYGRAFLVGVVFATVWTPCVGAILGSILALAAVSQTATVGAALLLVYSFGISVPFLIVSLSLAQAPVYLSFIRRYINIVSKIAGIILIVLGLLLVTNTYRFLNSWVFGLAFRFGYQIK
jgi:cytochrome c-type biogenesis protein